MASLVDLGGSLAVASMGFFNTGVSTDLNGETLKALHLPVLCIVLVLTARYIVTYIKSGGQAGDKIRVLAELDKSEQIHRLCLPDLY